VIPFYNDPYIREALESALAQTYEPIEILVVNDGSDRETERLQKLDGRIGVLNKRNGGTASALNAGFRGARGKYVAWLSSDDRFRPDKIEKQLRFMNESGYSISHTAFWRMNGYGEVDKQPIALHDRSMIHFYRSLLVSNTVNGCTVMMTRALFDRMGGFNELLPFTHDYDLWIRIVLSGFPIGYLNEPLTEYRIHPGMGTLRHQKEIQQEIASIQEIYSQRMQHLLSALQPN
jgi:glycosyltransferase involved in cell wall biosynthesis